MKYSVADNNLDLARKGRSARQLGSKHGKAKLTEAAVVEMRRLKAEGRLNQNLVARVFGTDPATISHAVRGKSWRHI